MAYVGNQPARGQWRKLTDISGSFNGVTTTFTTSVPPGTSEYYVTAGSASQLLISLGGVIQQPDTDYTVSTNSITFTTAPAAGLSFFGVLCGDALNTGTPSDGSVTTAKLAGSLSVGLTGGSASTPSLYFTSDANTGIYSPGSDQVAISTSGTGRLFITSTGNVGIGLSTPSFGAIDHGVHIYGSGAQEGIRLETTNGSTGILEIYAESGGNTLDTRGSGYIRFNNAATEWGRWDSSGRFLVGTSTSSDYNQFGSAPILQVIEKGGNDSAIGIERADGANASDGTLKFRKTRSSTPGGVTAVASGDGIGSIQFFGTDGTNEIAAASIAAAVDGTPGANDMPGRLVFATTADGASSPTERMRIANNGLIRSFSTDSSSRFTTSQGAGTTYVLFAGAYSATSVSDGTDSFRVTSNGNVTNTNNSYGAISDLKLKENIADAGSQWDDLKALQVRKYNFKEGQTHTQIGLIAQEVELVSPGLVSETPDRDAEGNDLGTVTKSVNYSVLYMKAVKALQEAMERIEQLEASNAAMEARLAALETS